VASGPTPLSYQAVNAYVVNNAFPGSRGTSRPGDIPRLVARGPASGPRGMNHRAEVCPRLARRASRKRHWHPNVGFGAFGANLQRLSSMVRELSNCEPVARIICRKRCRPYRCGTPRTA
jgi:hypothetical protein